MGTIPSGTLDSPLSTSLVRTPARSSMLHQVSEKTGFGNSYICSDWSINFCPVHAHATVHEHEFFPIQDGDTLTHMLSGSWQPRDTDISLVHNNSN